MTDSDLEFYVKRQIHPERIDEWKQAVAEITERMSQGAAFVACYLHQDSPGRVAAHAVREMGGIVGRIVHGEPDKAMPHGLRSQASRPAAAAEGVSAASLGRVA